MFLLDGGTRQAAHGQNARVGQCQGSVPSHFPPFSYLCLQGHEALRWGCYFVVSRTRGTCQKGVATSFAGSYNFPRNSKTSLGDLHRFRIALSPLL